jgi:hypothetical protein
VEGLKMLGKIVERLPMLKVVAVLIDVPDVRPILLLQIRMDALAGSG